MSDGGQVLRLASNPTGSVRTSTSQAIASHSNKVPSSKAKTTGNVGFMHEKPMVSDVMLRERCKSRLLVLTPIAKPMNRFAVCSDPRAETGSRIAKMTKDEMVGWFKSAPEGSRHQRMLWAAHKIAHLTGVTKGGAYQMLLCALIEAEREPPDEYLDVLGLTQ